MAQQILAYLSIALASGCLYYNLKAYFAQITSNVFSDRDYNPVLVTFLFWSLLLFGPLVNLGVIQSKTSVVILLLILLIAAIIATELTRQLRNSYMRPGAILHRPVLIRYWPSWVMRPQKLVLNEPAVFEFGLVESAFDLSLVLISETGASLQPDKRSKVASIQTFSRQERQQAADELVRSQYLVYPFSQHDEKAITESGPVLMGLTVMRIVCEAQDFEPNCKEEKSDIETLTEASLVFSLTPRKLGRKVILFKLLDMEGCLRGSMKVRCTVGTSKNKILEMAPKIAATLTTIFALIQSGILAYEKLVDIIPKLAIVATMLYGLIGAGLLTFEKIKRLFKQ